MTLGTADAAATPDCAYVVQRGDTLKEIADTHGVPLADVARWNDLADINLIEVGDTILLDPHCNDPEQAPAPAVASAPRRSASSGSLGPLLCCCATPLGALIGLVWLIQQLMGRSSTDDLLVSSTPEVREEELELETDTAIGEAHRATPSRPTRRRARDEAQEIRLGPPLIDRASRRRASKRARHEEARWLPPGTAIDVHGFDIQSGMIYVGSQLRAVTSQYMDEPALVDRSLPVDRRGVTDPNEGIGYWPSYASISPGARAVYLRWLADGRSDPDVDIGYVFLFFYGLERRMLADLRGDPEAPEFPVLVAELERLHDLYAPTSGSFASYCGRLLDFLHTTAQADDADVQARQLPFGGWGMPASLRIAVAERLASGEPLPAWLALRWAARHPNARLRTAAQRLPDLFEQTFVMRYEMNHGEGLVVRAPKRRLSLTYHPATASMRGDWSLDLDLPDPLAKRTIPKPLRTLIETVHDDLDGYSRWLGRHEDAPSQLPGLARLPAEVIGICEDEELAAFKAWLDAHAGELVPSSEVTTRWHGDADASWRKSEATDLAQLVSACGFGMEPDARYGGRRPDQVEQIYVFARHSEEPDADSESLATARVAVHLAAMMAHADGEVDRSAQDGLERHLEQVLDLKPGERERLRAHLVWMLEVKPSMRGMKKRLGALDRATRDALAHLLVLVASADQHISAGEARLIERCFGLLGFDKEEAHRRVHEAVANGSPPRDAAPITVRKARPMERFQIPKPPEKQEEPAASPGLDTERIQSILAQTREASAFLGDIFDEDASDDTTSLPEADAVDEEDGEDEDTEITSRPTLTLPPAHLTILKRLAEQATWTQDAFEELARAHDVFPGELIESLNDAAFDLCDAPLLESGDPIEVDPDILEEMLS